MPEPPTIEDIQDFIDGRLEGTRLRDLHAYLAKDEETARLVQQMRRTDSELRRLDNLRAGSRGSGSRSPPSDQIPSDSSGRHGAGGHGANGARNLPAMAVAACLLVAIGAGSGWWARMSAEEPNDHIANALLGGMTTTYGYLASSDLQGLDFSADQRDQWAEWTAEAYGRAIEPPDLSEHGYEFVGARIAPSAGLNGSVLAYRSEDDTTISVYCWKEDEGLVELPRQAVKNGYRINTDSGTGYGIAVIGPDGHKSLDPATRSVASAFREVFGET